MAVRSVFGRPGPDVTAEPFDIPASKVTNDAGLMPGATLKEGLDALKERLRNRISSSYDGPVVPPNDKPLINGLARTYVPGHTFYYSGFDNRALRLDTVYGDTIEDARYGASAHTPLAYPQGASWGIVYELDFRLPGGRSNLQPGAHTFTDPKYGASTWWLKGAAPHARMSSSLEDTLGLALTVTEGAPLAFPGTGDLSSYAWFMPLTQFSAFRPELPYIVLASLAVPGRDPAGRRNNLGLVGVAGWAANASPVLAAERSTELLVGLLARQTASMYGLIDLDFVYAKAGASAAQELGFGFMYSDYARFESTGALAVMRNGRAAIPGQREAYYGPTTQGETFLTRDYQDARFFEGYDLPYLAEPGVGFSLQTMDAAARKVYLRAVRVLQFGVNT